MTLLRRIGRHLAGVLFDFLFADLRFFNGVMGLVSLSQALRLWWPDTAFDLPGYEALRDSISENVFALLPAVHFAGVAFRQIACEFFVGRRWFWRVGQATHALGAVVFAAPPIGIAFSIHGLGIQGVGFCVISLFMVWQVFRTDI